MSDSAAQPAKAAVVRETPKFIRTKWVDVAVYGAKHISQKLLDVLGICLTIPHFDTVNHGVKTIVIGDLGLERCGTKGNKYPQGECWANAGAVAIDVNNIMDQAIDRCMTSQPNASVFAWYITNLLVTMLHEARHLSQLVAGTESDSEADTDLWAHQQLFELAKQFDIEPAEWTHEPYFLDAVLSWEDMDVEFVVKQQAMLDGRLFFHLPRSEDGPAVKCHSFRSYVGFMNKQDPGDETWLGTPIPVAPIAKAAAEIVPELNATAAVEAMGEQVGNIQPAEATPASNVICLGPGPEAVVVPEPATPAIVEGGDADNTYALQYMEDEEYGLDPDYEGVPFDTPAQQPTVSAAIQQAYAPTPPANPAVSNPFGAAAPAATPIQPDVVQRGPEVFVYNPTSMDDNTLIDVIQGIYFKCYNHIFAYCGQYNMGFTHPSKVCEMPVELDAREAEAVIKMDCLDANGRWCPGLPTGVQENTTGAVRYRLLGGIMKNTKLPYYKLYINFNGREVCRMLMPQNPLKQSGNGQFSKPALAAQQGSRIMYIKEGNDAIIAAGGKTWIGKIVDGRLEG